MSNNTLDYIEMKNWVKENILLDKEMFDFTFKMLWYDKFDWSELYIIVPAYVVELNSLLITYKNKRDKYKDYLNELDKLKEKYKKEAYQLLIDKIIAEE